MLVAKSRDIPYSEVTPKSSYLNRRKLLFSFPAAFLLARARAAIGLGNLVKSPLSANEKVNLFKDVITYNNFYEFGTSKEHPAQLAGDPKPSRLDHQLGQRRRYRLGQCRSARCEESWRLQPCHCLNRGHTRHDHSIGRFSHPTAVRFGSAWRDGAGARLFQKEHLRRHYIAFLPVPSSVVVPPSSNWKCLKTATQPVPFKSNDVEQMLLSGEVSAWAVSPGTRGGGARVARLVVGAVRSTILMRQRLARTRSRESIGTR